MPLIDHFGIIAPLYDWIFSPGEKENLINLINLPPGGLLLDVGGGTGRISQFFKPLSQGIYIADLSYEMLLQAKNKDGLLVTCSHSEKLPFHDEIFDRIIMIDALHHVCDQVETSEELIRVLKPDGRIIIEEPNIEKIGVKGLAVAEKILGMRSKFIPPSNIEKLFAGCSTRVESSGVNSWIIIEPGFT